MISERNWFSGKILRCHQAAQDRGALGSIPRLRIFCFVLHITSYQRGIQGEAPDWI